MTSPDRHEMPTSTGEMLQRTRRRAEQMRRQRRVGLAAATAALLAVAVALPLALADKGQHGRLQRVTGGPTSVAVPTPIITAPSRSTLPTSAATTTARPTSPPPSTANSPTTGAAAVPACATRQLTARLTNPSGAAGSVGYDLVFVNRSPTPCSLTGYPGVSYVTGTNGTTVGAPAQRDSFGTAGTVIVAPDGVAKAILIEVNSLNYPPDSCQLTQVDGLRIYPPNQTTALFVPQSTKACANPADPVLKIRPVVAS
jgi:hypothetical protein